MPASTGSCCCSDASGGGAGCQLVCKKLELATRLQVTGTALMRAMAGRLRGPWWKIWPPLAGRVEVRAAGSGFLPPMQLPKQTVWPLEFQLVLPGDAISLASQGERHPTGGQPTSFRATGVPLVCTQSVSRCTVVLCRAATPQWESR